jgi:sigma-B regulation protein RsbU (phosphoserine phosphatase)
LVAALESELTARTTSISGLAVHGVSQSAEGVMAGDWWDTIQRGDDALAIVVADVSGHGPSAAVTALRVRTILRSVLAEGLPAVTAVEMAARSCSDDTHFVTAIILELEPSAGRLSWVNAGHHPAIVVDHARHAYLCDPTGPLISSLGGTWTQGEVEFRAQDVVVAYTDGLVESRNAEGDELESSAVAGFMRDLEPDVRCDPPELVARLMAQVRHRAADWRRDDVTVVAAAAQNWG